MTSVIKSSHINIHVYIGRYRTPCYLLRPTPHTFFKSWRSLCQRDKRHGVFVTDRQTPLSVAQLVTRALKGRLRRTQDPHLLFPFILLATSSNTRPRDDYIPGESKRTRDDNDPVSPWAHKSKKRKDRQAKICSRQTRKAESQTMTQKRRDQTQFHRDTYLEHNAANMVDALSDGVTCSGHRHSSLRRVGKHLRCHHHRGASDFSNFFYL